MPVTLLRWKSGAGGDTVLKLLLDSNKDFYSQNRYTNLVQGKTVIDQDYVNNFQYSEVAKMSLADDNINYSLLRHQLELLNNDRKIWLLKTHLYVEYNFNTIDIVLDKKTLPFAVKASLKKNSRQNKLLNNYHLLTKKIKDPELLYKFDCYNFAYDRANINIVSDKKITVENLLKGWHAFVLALEQFDLFISDKSKDYYEHWLSDNKQFFPSQTYVQMIENNDYNFRRNDLSIEERYCLLVLSNNKFEILQ